VELWCRSEWEQKSQDQGCRKDALFLARLKIRRWGFIRGRKELFELIDIGILVFLATLGLVQLGHESDEEGILKLVIVENGTVTESVGFLGTKEAMSRRRRVIGSSETVDGLREVFTSFKVVDDVVHVVVIWVVRVLEGSLELTNRTVVRVLELGRSEMGVAIVPKCFTTRWSLLGWTIRIGEVIAESDLQHARLEEGGLGGITAVEARDTEEIGRVETTVDK
jgi:hypothetical protein